MIKVIERVDPQSGETCSDGAVCMYDRIINDEHPNMVFSDVELSEPSEDWMRLQLAYFKHFEGDPKHYKRYCVGGIELRPTTPTTMHVYRVGMDADATEDFLFAWSSDKDQTEYDSDGDYTLSAEFAWRLCYEVEKRY